MTLQVWDIGGQTLGGKMLDKYVYGAHVRHTMHNSVLLLLIVLCDLIYSNFGFNLHFKLSKKAKINKNA